MLVVVTGVFWRLNLIIVSFIFFFVSKPERRHEVEAERFKQELIAFSVWSAH